MTLSKFIYGAAIIVFAGAHGEVSGQSPLDGAWVFDSLKTHEANARYFQQAPPRAGAERVLTVELDSMSFTIGADSADPHTYRLDKSMLWLPGSRTVLAARIGQFIVVEHSEMPPGQATRVAWQKSYSLDGEYLIVESRGYKRYFRRS